MLKKSQRIVLLGMSLFLALALLAGCAVNETSRKADSDSSGKPLDTATSPINESPSSPKDSPVVTDEPPAAIEEDPTEESEQPLDTKPPASDENTKSAYNKGTVTDSSFQSEYLNLRFELPEGYVMATEDELYAMIDFGVDNYLDIDRSLVDYALANTVYEMMASSIMGFPAVQVFAEKLAFKNMTIDQYLVAFKQQLLKITGMELSSTEAETEQFVGETYAKVSALMNTMGMEVKQDYLFRKLDNRIVGVILTYTSDKAAEKDDLMKAFTSY